MSAPTRLCVGKGYEVCDDAAPPEAVPARQGGQINANLLLSEEKNAESPHVRRQGGVDFGRNGGNARPAAGGAGKEHYRNSLETEISS